MFFKFHFIHFMLHHFNLINICKSNVKRKQNKNMINGTFRHRPEMVKREQQKVASWIRSIFKWIILIIKNELTLNIRLWFMVYVDIYYFCVDIYLFFYAQNFYRHAKLWAIIYLINLIVESVAGTITTRGRDDLPKWKHLLKTTLNISYSSYFNTKIF